MLIAHWNVSTLCERQAHTRTQTDHAHMQTDRLKQVHVDRPSEHADIHCQTDHLCMQTDRLSAHANRPSVHTDRRTIDTHLESEQLRTGEIYRPCVCALHTSLCSIPETYGCRLRHDSVVVLGESAMLMPNQVAVSELD
jgi:hypothetical protein